MGVPLLLVEFPIGENDSFHWWHVEDGQLNASGANANPLEAAGLRGAADETDALYVAALVRSSDAAVRWHETEPELTEKQALAAVILAERDNLLDPESTHIAAVAGQAGLLATASINRAVLDEGLVRLQELGIEPDVVVPSGWLIEPKNDTIVQADLGFDSLLRGEQSIMPDEPAFRDQIMGGRTVELSPEEVETALLIDDGTPLLNLRSGVFAKKQRASIMSAKQKHVLGWLVAALLLVSIAIPVIQWAKYSFTADAADDAALSAATSVLGPVDNLDAAERELDRQLAAKSLGDSVFLVPASALFSALQKTPAVTLTALSYRGDGTVLATLSAVRNEDINPALLDLQASGFLVTATPRTDATGMARAEISVRAQ